MRAEWTYEETDPHPNSPRMTALYPDDRVNEVIASARERGFHTHIFDLTKVLIPIPMPAGEDETYVSICRGKSKGGAFG